MATASHILLLLALVALTPSTFASRNVNLNLNLNLHQLLQLLGFPPGLIPDPIESFAISPAGFMPLTFDFTVRFKKPCYVQYVYLNYFAPVFTGRITYGKITGMKGHKDQFPSGEWIDMYDVTVVGQKLVFKFATATVTYDRALFEEVKTCKDGPAIAIADHSNELISNELISQLPISAE
ncbi:hypothetical protein HanRHA438_Chr14g0629981 [Helianthus annuus]|uniref:Transmembrane protein n=1 Tax=Helianthus annuus TaxID=4232 RepID=A0A9K3H6M8_HELAN|nr:hypothetical protein HanXRQr2_Chr14g0620001 [Helianthus annuus]KAJ0851701.1 hypothetical protein HanRHA438_Chr14g0629981 [Helianthus annuus]